MKRSRPLAPNIVANLSGQLLLLLLSLVAVKLVFGRLGQDALGMVLFVQTVNVVLAGLLDLGFSSVTVREVAAHVTDEPAYVMALVRTASTVYWVGFSVIAIVTLVSAPWIARHWVNLGAMDAGTATAILRILGVAALSALPRALYVSLFRGLQRSAYNNGIDVASGLIQQAGTLVIIAGGGSLMTVIIWLAAGYAAGLAAYIVALSRFFPLVALVPGWSMAVIRRNARFSLHTMWISILSIVHTYFDKLVISKLLPIASLGPYGVASALIARGALVTTAIAEAAYPSLSALHHAGEAATMLRQYRTLQDFLCYATVPLYAGIVYASAPLFGILFGTHVAQILLFPVAVMCIGSYLNGTLTIPYMFSLAVGKPEITSRVMSQLLVVTIPLTIAAVARFGLAGAGVSYLVYHVIAYLIEVPQYCRNCLLIPTRAFYRDAGTVIMLATLTYGSGYAIAAWFGHLQWPALTGVFILASILFAAAGFQTIDPGLRTAATALLRRTAGERLPHAA